VNTSYSLHKITEKDNCPFNETAYSEFKFGNRAYAKQFAKELFTGFISRYSELLLSSQEIVILPSPYLSIPTASNFLCHYFKIQLNKFLFENNKKASIESKIYRNQTYVTDYGNLDFEERLKLISNDTYYLDRNFIDGKLCIFVDDIKITGSHEHTVNKILKQFDVNGDFIFLYFAELVNRDIHPNIENYYNYFSIKNVQDIVDLINKENFQFNTRIVKFILKLDESEFLYLTGNIPKHQSDELFHLAVSNNYHQITEYQSNINIIKQD